MDAKSLPLWTGACEDLRVDNVEETWSYTQALCDIYEGTRLNFECYYRSLERLDVNGTTSITNELYREVAATATRFTSFDAFTLIVFATVWTALRFAAVSYFLLPVARSTGVFHKYISKFCESAWKGTAYLILWSTAYYMSFYRSYTFYTKPMSIWESGIDGAPSDLTMLYALEASFYIHSLYATMYLDTWRKDSVAMMIHHFITLTLIIGSYSVGLFQTGALVFLLDDIGDVILEYGKVCNYLKLRSNGPSTFFAVASELFSVAFAVQWFVLRVYLHVTKVWRSTTLGVWYSAPPGYLPGAVQIPFIILFGLLYGLYLYWFGVIIFFVKRVLTGKTDDIREDFEDDVLESKKIQ